MAFLTRCIAAPVTLCLLSALPVQANDNLSVNASARAGLEQQSNVNISELEQASGQSDVATLLEADIKLQWQTTPALSLEAGYSVQDKNYHQADAFDSRLQLAYLDSSYQLGTHTIGGNLYYARADLAQTRFLTLQQASLYSMHNLNETTFMRPAVTVSNKTFDRFSERDANITSASLDTFWFFAEGRRFINLGLLYEDENSRDNAFSYQAPGLRLKLSGRYTLWQFDHTLQLGAKFSQRNYQSVPDSNNDTPRRQDTQYQLDVSWKLDVTSHLALLTKLEHGDFSSTLDSADYRETRGSLALQLSF